MNLLHDVSDALLTNVLRSAFVHFQLRLQHNTSNSSNSASYPQQDWK